MTHDDVSAELVDVADRLAALVDMLIERFGVVSRPVQRASQARRLVEHLLADLADEHERSGAFVKSLIVGTATSRPGGGGVPPLAE